LQIEDNQINDNNNKNNNNLSNDRNFFNEDNHLNKKGIKYLDINFILNFYLINISILYDNYNYNIILYILKDKVNCHFLYLSGMEKEFPKENENNQKYEKIFIKDDKELFKELIYDDINKKNNIKLNKNLIDKIMRITNEKFLYSKKEEKKNKNKNKIKIQNEDTNKISNNNLTKRISLINNAKIDNINENK